MSQHNVQCVWMCVYSRQIHTICWGQRRWRVCFISIGCRVTRNIARGAGAYLKPSRSTQSSLRATQPSTMSRTFATPATVMRWPLSSLLRRWNTSTCSSPTMEICCRSTALSSTLRVTRFLYWTDHWSLLLLLLFHICYAICVSVCTVHVCARQLRHVKHSALSDWLLCVFPSAVGQPIVSFTMSSQWHLQQCCCIIHHVVR